MNNKINWISRLTLICFHNSITGGKSFAYLKTLTNHKKSVHEGIKDYICEEDGCIRAFTTAPELSKHIERVHVGAKDHICERCGKGKFSPLLFCSSLFFFVYFPWKLSKILIFMENI